MNALRRWQSKDSSKGSVKEDEAVTAGVVQAGPSTSGSSSAGLSISSGKIRVNLAQETSNITPGSQIRGTVIAEGLGGDAKLLKVTLLGEAGATVMGKQKWQTATAMATFSGAGAGGAVPLTYRETHPFLNIEQILWQNNAGEGKSISSNGANDTSHFSFSIDVPRIKQCTCEAATWTLPPSVDLRNGTFDAPMDRSTAEIAYTLKVRLEKHGKLKRDTRLRIPLKLLDDSPPDYALREEKTVVGRGPLKFASENAKPPLLECQLTFTPPTSRDGILYYVISWRLVEAGMEDDLPSYEGDPDEPPTSPDPPTMPTIYRSSSTPLFSHVEPKIEVSLSRRTTTRPVEKPKDGQTFNFPTYMLVKGKNEEPVLHDGVGEIRGTLQIPADEVTAFTCGVDVKHAVHARIMSPALLRPVSVRSDVYLPSG